MAIVRWDPFRNMMSIKKQMDRALREWDDEAPTNTSAWRPAVDIVENENELVLDVELPGIDKKDIKIGVENRVLSVSGERAFSDEVKEENCHRIERSYGSFYRSFTLPTSVDSEKIEAGYDNGVLKIRLPKREEVKPRQIEVKVK